MTKTTFLLLLALPFVASPVALGGCATTQTFGEQVDDDAVGMRVGRRLTADPDVRRYEIDVDVIDGVVTLRGDVDSQAMADRAVSLAESTEGVARVVNQLMVAPDGLELGDEDERDDGLDDDDDEIGTADVDDDRTDVGIKAAVGSRLLAAPDVHRVNIDVDVVEGVVFLSGIVEDQAAKDSAERIATSVDGVKRVQNDLQVDGSGRGSGDKSGMDDQSDESTLDEGQGQAGKRKGTTGTKVGGNERSEPGK